MNAAEYGNYIKLFLPPLITGLTGTALGFYLGRWQKHRELFYIRKLETYNSFRSALYDFGVTCRSSSCNWVEALHASQALQRSFNEASFYMPQSLLEDIRAKMRPAFDRTKNMHAFVTNPASEFDKLGAALELNDANACRKALKEFLSVLNDFSTSGPGPFEPLCDAIPEIIEMLKKDLGSERLGGSFYQRSRGVS